jgi:molybdopterin-guanine dinucleotide biosynthesis protein A
MKALTAFVLAGGKSSRMGTDKAFLEFSGRSLLGNALELARAVTAEVRIVGDPVKLSSFGTVVPDVYRDRGPLGGIHAALASSDAELNLIIAADLPLLDVRFLKHLIDIAGNYDALVTVPRVHGHYEPLCAVYRKEFGAFAGEALAENRNKVDALFSTIAVQLVSDDELTTGGFSPTMFRNVNTPDDWKQIREEFVNLPTRL